MDEEATAATSREDERARWMVAAQGGDSAAYESLLISLLPILRAFVHRRGIAGSEVEDVVQEVLLLIHRARHTWRPDRAFDPWMWAVARNATTDALRRQGRERSRREPIPEEFGENSLAAGAAGEGFSNAEQLLASQQLDPRLSRALGTLPAVQRQAVEFLYVEQLSVAEAAARAGVTATALKVRAHRGSRALRAALEAEGES
jgi:RNA polymerase sigma-70 factor (ECF subfamily)